MIVDVKIPSWTVPSSRKHLPPLVYSRSSYFPMMRRYSLRENKTIFFLAAPRGASCCADAGSRLKFTAYKLQNRNAGRRRSPTSRASSGVPYRCVVGLRCPRRRSIHRGGVRAQGCSQRSRKRRKLKDRGLALELPPRHFLRQIHLVQLGGL